MSIRNIFARVGETGFVVMFVTQYKPSSIDSAVIHFTDPDGVVLDKTCDVVDTSAGTYGWTHSGSDVFDQAGKWRASLEIDIDGGATNVRKSKEPKVLWIGEDSE